MPLAGLARIAVPDVPAHPPVQQHSWAPVPARQHRVQIRVVLAPTAGYQQRPEGPPQPGSGARGRRMGTSRPHAEHVGQAKAGEVMPQAQLDGLTIIQAELAQSRGGNPRLAELSCRRRARTRPR